MNGVRIELGHVAAAALKCAGIHDARAVAAADAEGRTCIVLAVLPANVSTQALLAELSSHLPHVYMPAAALALASLPTLPNNKTDRKQLQARARPGCDGTCLFVTTRNRCRRKAEE